MGIRDLVLLIGAAHGIIMSMMLARKNRKEYGYFILLLLFVSLFLFIQLIAPYSVYPKISLLSYVFIYAYVPVYILHLQQNLKSRILIKNGLLFLPSVAFLIACTPYLLMPREELATTSYSNLIITDLLAISTNIFLLLRSSKLINQQKKNQQLRVNHYFHALMVITSLMWFFGMLQTSNILQLPITLSLDRIFIGMSMFVFGVGYFLMRPGDKSGTAPAYERLNLSRGEQEKISQLLIQHIQKTKPYLNPDCTQAEVAQAVGIEKTKLSFVINRYMNTNFNRLMNDLRIEEFLSLIRQQQLDIYDLTGVASKAGFRSKSTFYKAFKDVYGVSPKEYLNQKQPDVLTKISSN